eukprot:gene8029-8225_t
MSGTDIRQQQWGPQLLHHLQQSKLLSEFVISGTGVACGTTITNPIDVVKTRLQLQPQKCSSSEAGRGLLSTGLSIVQHEGLLGLWKGWAPAVVRGMFYGGERSSYRLQCGMECGAGQAVQVRLQAPNAPHNSALAVVSAVVKESGVKGLWKGATPGVVRAAVLTASQCATYDEVKGRVMAVTGWRDTASTHLATAMITGLVSTTATNPVDVVKTFMFVGGKSHSSPIACAAAIYHQHGFGGFWRGWLANYTRLGPQTVVTFLVVEQLRATMGMSALGS